MKLLVFDIGKTLMEFKNMPNVWINFYSKAFKKTANQLNYDISKEDIDKSVEVLKLFNPTVNYREIEYSPEYIFSTATAHWKRNLNISDVIYIFFESMNLVPVYYSETFESLLRLKSQGYNIATLTDIVTGMPDRMNKSFIKDILPYIDFYVSSLSCGYRKPNPMGLYCISKHFYAQSSNMVFIRDEKKDIMTAKRFGCKSILINRTSLDLDYGQDFTIHNLLEVENLPILFDY